MTHLLPQRGEPLLLCVSVDIGADTEGHKVEEWHPGMLWEELLRKGQGDWRSDPADFHDWHETSTDGGTDLMPGAGAGNESHGGQIDGVLDGCDLKRSGEYFVLVAGAQMTTYHQVAGQDL